MANSPAPTGILINSHSLYAPHKAYMKALEWSPTPNVNGAGSIATWNAGTIDADDMVQAFVNVLIPFFPTSYAWDNYVIFTYPTPEADPEPMASGSLTQVGTSGSPGWSKAVQQTLTFRTNLFGLARIVMLDADSSDEFDRHTAVPVGGSLEALINVFTDDDNGWSGNDNGRPDVYLGATKTLNEKLRREYRMT